MPNTLAHIGVQGVFSRAVFSRDDLKWVLLGCVVPDVPWILRRVVYSLGPDIPSYDLKLYFLVQSSLFCSLLLCGALSVVSRHAIRVFFILALNCLIHLLLDATQIKWGSGVHLLAPFSWELLNFDLFWPESSASIVLTLAGLVFYVHAWIKQPGTVSDLAIPTVKKAVAGFILLVLYLLLPGLLISGPEAMDNRYVATLRHPDQRAGKFVEFDREFFSMRDGAGVIRTWEGVEFVLPDVKGPQTGNVSAKATLTGPHTLEVHEIHFHPRHHREMASYLGLVLVALFWARSFRAGRGDPKQARGKGHIYL
jgi:hypothetical protein